MTIPVFGAGQDLPFLSWRVAKHASSAFTGAASAHGDKDAANTYKIFTVTGVIMLKALFGVVGTTLVGVGGDISIGVTGNAGIWANADNAPDWATGDILGNAAAAGQTDLADTGLVNTNFIDGEMSIVNGVDIVETTATADITGGQIDYFCIWAPMEEGASIVEAGTLSQV